MRYRVVSDDDGHDYIIPADKADEFEKWLDFNGNFWINEILNDDEKKDEDLYWTGYDFESDRLTHHIGCYTFGDYRLEND